MLWAAALAGLVMQVVWALVPVRLSIEWRGCVRTGGHLALRAQLRYLLVRVRLRGALVAAPPFPAGVAARIRLVPALGLLTLSPRTFQRGAPWQPRPFARVHDSDPGTSAPVRSPAPRGGQSQGAAPSRPGEPARARFGRRRAGSDTSWKREAATAFVGAMKGRLVAPRLTVAVRVGARDAMATALGAASAQALISAVAAGLVCFLAPSSPRPRIVVRPAFGRAALEARGELVVQVRAFVVVLALATAALAAARAGLRGAPSPGSPQRASAHNAAA